uniref:Pentatricopeptide repeat-containing protein n=1 Tax=Nelumbo nucifera TaxID=4432 RepID=A0A822Z4B3_NELNU|nr:TPA_asm: hypothetical protein HUJ06_013706 [Nelumbo nucifera]
MYAKCGEPGYAPNLFDTTPQRNLLSWISLISGFSQNGRFLEALRTFVLMRGAGEKPTQFAFSSVIQSSAPLGLIEFGKQLHFLIFDEMPCEDEVSWTAMIDGYTKNGNFEEALLSFKKMSSEGVTIAQHVFCSTLGSCGALKVSKIGMSLHSSIVKLGFESEIFVGNALTDMYSKAGDMESSLSVFGLDSEHMNVVSCTSLIDGYVDTNQADKALNSFVELKKQGIEPN